jgi:hypothetical protein
MASSVKSVTQLLSLILMISVAPVAQTRGTPPPPRIRYYSDSKLAFRYTLPNELRDKTQRFRRQIQEQARTSGATSTLSALLAMSSGPDSNAPEWGSVTIETYPRNAVSEPDDAKAEMRMNAWVAHSRDATALPRQVVISGQLFTMSIFGLQEGNIKKGAMVWTTVRMGQLLSFAFAANSAQVLQRLTETMKTVKFF